jgi:(p)ppGpp synthase/HD superfamily hydrolase
MTGYTDRVDQAMLLAMKLHRNQTRKGRPIPYVSHVWGVASLVAEMEGTEDEVIAALLHDGPEDCGGRPVLDHIRQTFGSAVAEIVEGCTDTFDSPKPPWRQRKEQYLHHLETASQSVIKVSLADKLHNVRSILDELKQRGPIAFEKFSGKQDGTIWYYEEVSRRLAQRHPGFWSNRLSEISSQLREWNRKD